MNDSMRFDDENGVNAGATPATPKPRMSAHAPDLDRFLRDRGICYVRAEYSGADDRGGFVALEFTREDGAYCHVPDGNRHLQIKAVFRALLLTRYPSWFRGYGSCGDFRWDLSADALTHSHYVRASGSERLTIHGL